MGWNAGYRILEATVITVYDEGLLTKDLLNKLMQPFVDHDVDHGGKKGLLSADKLNADEIICKVMRPEEYAKIPPDESCHQGDCPRECTGQGRSCKISALWHKITREEWGFW